MKSDKDPASVRSRSYILTLRYIERPYPELELFQPEDVYPEEEDRTDNVVYGYTRKDLEAFFEENNVAYLVGQVEEGNKKKEGEISGYVHWQLWLEFETARTWASVAKMFPHGHIETRWGTPKRAFEYVTKEETRYPDLPRLELGKKPDLDSYSGKRTDLDAFYELIETGLRPKEIYAHNRAAFTHHRLIEEFYIEHMENTWSTSDREVEAHYICGKAEDGKKTMVDVIRGLYAPNEVYVVTDYKHPWDKYDYEPVIILGKYDSQFDFEDILSLQRGAPQQLPARYASKWAAHSTLWIVSDLALWEQYPGKGTLWPEFQHGFNTVSGAQRVEEIASGYRLIPLWQEGGIYRGKLPKHAKFPKTLDEIVKASPVLEVIEGTG